MVAGLQDVRELAEELDLPVVGDVLDVLEAFYGNAGWDQLFAAIDRAKKALEDLERQAVRYARLEGETWEEIGDYLGISRQGAYKRYGTTGLAELDALDDLHKAEMGQLLGEMKLAVARAERDLSHLEPADRRKTAGRKVLADSDWFERMMSLSSRHSAARRELVEQLESAENGG